MTTSPFQHVRRDALHRLRSRLLRAFPDDGPDDDPAVQNGSFARSTTTRPLADWDVVVMLAQRNLAGGRFAHVDPAALPLTLHTPGPAAGSDNADEVDEGFFALADAARAEPGGALVVVLRLPDRAAAGPLTGPEVEQLHAAAAERATATLGGPEQLEVGGRGIDVLALVRGRHVGPDFLPRLARFAEALAAPVPVDGRHALVRAHLALVPLATDADVPTAAALHTARAGLPTPAPLTWTSPSKAIEVSPGYVGEQAEMLLRARAAIAAGRFVLLYREIHCTDKLGVAGGRAVPAWIDTDGTEHLFTELEDVAGVTGLLREVFDHTLPALCRDLLLWRSTRRRTTPHVLLEVPEQLLRERYLHGRLAPVLQARPVPPSLLILGIPAAALATVDGIDEHLHQLSDLGVQLAITGYGDTSTPLAVLARRRWNFAVIPRAVLAKLEGHHPDGVDVERAIVQALARTAEQLKIRLVADDITLPGAGRHLLTDLYVPPRDPITADEFAEHTWIELPEFPPGCPEPVNFSVPGSQPGYPVPAQRAGR